MFKPALPLNEHHITSVYRRVRTQMRHSNAVHSSIAIAYRIARFEGTTYAPAVAQISEAATPSLDVLKFASGPCSKPSWRDRSFAHSSDTALTSTSQLSTTF